MQLAKGNISKTVRGTAALKIKGHPEHDVPVWANLNAAGGIVSVEMRGYYVPTKGDQLQNRDILQAREVVTVEMEEDAEKEDE
jgi:hypothetical protein